MSEKVFPLATRVIQTREELQALAPSWHELFQNSRVSYPFVSFHWVMNWWDTFSCRGWQRRDRLHIIGFYEQEKLVGIAPMILSVFLPWLFPGIRFLRPIGSDRNLTEIKGFLCLPGYEEQLTDLLKGYFERNSSSWDFCQWPDIRSKQVESLTQSLGQECMIENFLITLPTSWEEFRLSRKRNVREAIRKCINKPQSEGVNFIYQRLENRQDILNYLPEFYRLHALRGAMDKGPTHPDYFAEQTHRQLIESMLVSDSSEFKLCLFMLKHGEKIIAIRLGYEMNQVLCLYYSGFDPEYGTYSAVTRLLVETMQDSINRNLKSINLSTGRDLSKTRWSPEEHSYYRPFMVGNRWRSRMFSKLLLKYLASRYKPQVAAATAE